MSIILDGTNGITSAGSVNVDELKDKDSTGAPDFPNGISAEYVIVDSGSAASPSSTFDGDTNTGMFRPDEGKIGWSCNGEERLRLETTNLFLGATNPGQYLARLRVGASLSVGSRFIAGTAFQDTGININADAGGACMFLMASRNTGAGTSTAAATYVLTFRFDGNNPPASTYIGGSSNFLTFGVSASNTLTIRNANGGNCFVTWLVNR